MARLVKPESDMDDDTLIRHFNARHMPIASLTSLRVQFPGERMLREYHARVHRLGNDGVDRPVNHTHRGDEAL